MFNQLINQPNIDKHDKVIVFDSECKLCNKWSRFIITHDSQRQIKLCATQSNAGSYLSQSSGYSSEQPETILYLKNGGYFIKSEAFFELMADLEYPWKFVGIFRLLPLALRDRAYDIVARNRYKIFGKYDRCRLPNADHTDRYL